MQWVVVIKIYFVEKAEGGYISTMIQIRRDEIKRELLSTHLVATRAETE